MAYALDESGSPITAKFGKVDYYLANKNNDELIIVSAVGHLYSIIQIGDGWKYPIYGLKWVPTYTENKEKGYTKQYLDTIIALSKNVDVYVSACDYDQEGSLIAFNIIKYGIGEKALTKSHRMFYSNMTSQALNTSWENKKSILDFPIISAGKSRHEVDWLFGINLSRALSIAANHFLDLKVLSIGRVQGPTLNFVYEKEQIINSHIPIPYWIVYVESEIDGKLYSLQYEKSALDCEIHAKELVESCKGEKGTVIDIQNEKKYIQPPSPFNLGDLQSEAYLKFKMNPSKTLELAEKLYLGGYISYPRTDSNKIPTNINIKEILENLSKNIEYASESKELIIGQRFQPISGKGDDPAHPAIHPTGQNPEYLNVFEKKIYDLVVRRFLSSLGDSLVQLKTNIIININNYKFYLKGNVTKKEGWTKFYKQYYKSQDQIIPDIKLGQQIQITKLSTKRKYSKPPPRYNSVSLIRKMEQEKIGTKSTRSNIVGTLYQRGYIKNRAISISRIGEKIIETLEIYCPEIIQVKLTRDLEEKLIEVEEGKKDSESVFNEVVDELRPILSRFKDNEDKIGWLMATSILNNTVNDPDISCKICSRKKLEGSVFCPIHKSVYEKIENDFLKWRYAVEYQWLEYLQKLNTLSWTGCYVKEVIESILS